jgi:hypothetical protein
MLRDLIGVRYFGTCVSCLKIETRHLRDYSLGANFYSSLHDAPFLSIGVFEGKTGSLLHPVMMFGMLMLSASTALLGFEWRRQRTIGGEISDLKKTLPKLNGASSVKEALKVCQAAEEIDLSQLALLKSALPIDSQIQELQNERKTLTGEYSLYFVLQ